MKDKDYTCYKASEGRIFEILVVLTVEYVLSC